jgi:hypothetical protein
VSYLVPLFINTLGIFQLPLRIGNALDDEIVGVLKGRRSLALGGALWNKGGKLGRPSMSPRSEATDAGSSFRHPLRGFPLFWLLSPGFRYAPPRGYPQAPLSGVRSEQEHSFEYVIESMKRST